VILESAELIQYTMCTVC